MSPTWVVGAGGLLGKALVRTLTARRVPVVTRTVPWSDPTATQTSPVFMSYNTGANDLGVTAAIREAGNDDITNHNVSGPGGATQ